MTIEYVFEFMIFPELKDTGNLIIFITNTEQKLAGISCSFLNKRYIYTPINSIVTSAFVHVILHVRNDYTISTVI